MRLIGKPIPGWVNRLAKVGSFCHCLLPENIQVAAVRHLPDHATYSDEGSDSGDSSLTIGSEEKEDEVDHHLLTAPNSELAFLQDTPILVASYLHTSLQKGECAIGGGNITTNHESEKGLLTLVSSDAPGLQVRDPNGRWYLADYGSAPGDLLLLTGKALSHATAGLRPAASYRAATDANAGRSPLAFRLMPQGMPY